MTFFFNFKAASHYKHQKNNLHIHHLSIQSHEIQPPLILQQGCRYLHFDQWGANVSCLSLVFNSTGKTGNSQTATAQIEMIQLNNELNGRGVTVPCLMITLEQCFLVIQCQERLLKISYALAFQLQPAFFPQGLESVTPRIVRRFKQGEGEQLFELSCVTHKKHAIGKNLLNSNQTLWESFIACISKSSSLMFHLLQGLGWGERKTANEIKQKFSSPSCLAIIQCARGAARCLQILCLCCINFTGCLVQREREERERKKTHLFPIKSA